MNITIESIKENDDGSADCAVNLDDEAINFLIRYALINCLTEAVDKGKSFSPIEGEE